MIKEIPPETIEGFFAKRVDFYDHHMLTNVELGKFYQDIPSWIDFPGPALRVLDLGIGTGLELVAFYEKYPELQVTGIDLSSEMLEKLREKYPDKPMNLLCGSFFDVDFGTGFDVALSVYALHHFVEEKKQGLYRKIYEALSPGGVFLLGDFIVSSQELQDMFMAENDRIREVHGITDSGFYHIDIPLTMATEIRLLKEAGFTTVSVLLQQDYAGVILAHT
jgi:tRNA (cmo5U34)-methyltransferase